MKMCHLRLSFTMHTNRLRRRSLGQSNCQMLHDHVRQEVRLNPLQLKQSCQFHVVSHLDESPVQCHLSQISSYCFLVRYLDPLLSEQHYFNLLQEAPLVKQEEFLFVVVFFDLLLLGQRLLVVIVLE